MNKLVAMNLSENDSDRFFYSTFLEQNAVNVTGLIAVLD